MPATILALCCFLGCPLLMGAMWLVTRDPEKGRLEREIRRLNRAATNRPSA